MFPAKIPSYYRNLINWQDPHDPLRLMVEPDEREEDVRDYELTDPIGDRSHEPVPGLIHRYPDRCLLLLSTYCLVHCRFCFRREVVGKVRPVQFQRIQQYLTEQTALREIIFSGGDPFTFPIGFLQSVTQHLAPLQHLEIWRFHTRVPAIDPGAISQEWIDQLAVLQQRWRKQVVVVVHVNHPREVTPEFRAVIDRLQAAGCMILAQSVLLKGINDNVETLSALFRSLVNVGVKPYYLHHLDQVVGTHHFRISIARGKQLFLALRGNLSGLCVPEYVLDLPGGYGKVPVMWLRPIDGTSYQATTYEGKTITYVDHADEAEDGLQTSQNTTSSLPPPSQPSHSHQPETAAVADTPNPAGHTGNFS